VSFVKDHLEHHGVKGQKWGVRRTKAALARAAKRENRHPPSEEHVRARELLSKGKPALTNKELKDLNERLQLEQNFSRLNPSTVARGRAKTAAIIGTIGLVGSFVRSPPGKLAVAAGKVAVGNILAKSPLAVIKGLPINVK
jgi:hypothetical protein